MPGRVREYNAMQAAGIAASLGIPVPMWGQPVNGTGNAPPPTCLQRNRERWPRAQSASRPMCPARGSARGAGERCDE